jgi:hypothetical protein
MSNTGGKGRGRGHREASFLLVTSLDAAVRQPHRYIVHADVDQLPPDVGPGSRVICHGDLCWRDEVMAPADPESRHHRTFTLLRATVEHVDVAPPIYVHRHLSAGQMAMREEITHLRAQLTILEGQLAELTELNTRLRAHIHVLDPHGAYCRLCGGAAVLDGLCYACYLEQYQPIAEPRTPPPSLLHQEQDEPIQHQPTALRY